MKLRHTALLFFSSFLMPACGMASGEVTAIHFSRSSYVLSIGETVQLHPILEGGTKDVIYYSTDDRVVTVSPQGLVTAIGAGEATVLGICNDHIANAVFEVEKESESSKIYKIDGVTKSEVKLPAFGITGTTEEDIHFIYEGKRFGDAYFDTTIPDTPVNRMICAIATSPFIAANPDYALPESYVEYADMLNKAFSAGKAPVTAKNYFSEETLTAFLFHQEEHLGHTEIDLSSPVQLGKMAIAVAQAIPEIVDHPDDIIKLLYGYLDDGEASPKSVEQDSFLYALITNGKLKAYKETNKFTLTAYIDESSSKDFLSSFSFSFGADALIHNLSVSVAFLRENENKPFRVGELDFDLSAYLLGGENVAKANLSFPKEREEAPKDSLSEIKKSLPFDEKKA